MIALRIGIVSLLFCTSLLAKDPEVIPYLDINKYTGTWYEIALLPNIFQSDCASRSSAKYTRLPNGEIKVENECYTNTGAIKKVSGIARITDPKTQSKLSVSFVDFLGIRPFWGDYWVLGIGDQYQYSVVGGRDRNYAWILSRTPTLSQADLDNARSILKKNGYRTDKLKLTPQSSIAPK